MKIKDARSISEAHAWMINEIIWTHQVIQTEDGETTWEYPDSLTVTIHHPLTDMIHPSSSFQENRCEEYAKQILEPSMNGFEYTYHDRLFQYPVNGVQVNQIFHAIRKLKQNPNTRRAIAITIEPQADNKNQHIPCLQFIQYVIRDGKLNQTVVFRSEDILSAAGPNMFGLAKLMEYVAKQVGIPVGTYTHIVTVPHLYSVRDKADLQRWL
jgi:thymidylate synthase